MTLLEKKRLEVINLNRELRILDATGDLAALNTNSTKSSVTARTTQASHRSRDAFGKGLLLFEHFNSCPAKPNMHSTNRTRLGGIRSCEIMGRWPPVTLQIGSGLTLGASLQVLNGKAVDQPRIGTKRVLLKTPVCNMPVGRRSLRWCASGGPLRGAFWARPSARRAVARSSVLAPVPNQRRKWVFVDAIPAQPASPGERFPLPGLRQQPPSGALMHSYGLIVYASRNQPLDD
jgi:hypothetical protein